ncbi:hypothetical protein [Saccharopolyspora aridisoli]|nr:hypothetical protein [Saccharopolyspora aridisoli]
MTVSGKGVQLERSRDALVEDGVPTAEFDDYIAAVERAVSGR